MTSVHLTKLRKLEVGASLSKFAIKRQPLIEIHRIYNKVQNTGYTQNRKARSDFGRKQLKEAAHFWKKKNSWTDETKINLYQNDSNSRLLKKESNSS